MNTDNVNQDISTLKRSNNELKRAIKHFIDSAPNYGPLAVQIDEIRNALKSNEAMFTFAALVEKYAKMKNNFDNIDHQSAQKDMNKFKSLLKKSAEKNLSSSQAEKVNNILSEISLNQPAHSILLDAGKAIEYFAEDLGKIRESSKVVVNEREIQTEETGVVAADIHLASKKLIKDVIVICKQLAKTYPNDKFISEVLHEATNVPDAKGTFFISINLLERTTTYLALLIQQERCAAEEMLRDIHTNLVNVFNQTKVIQSLLECSKDDADDVRNGMVFQLKNMEIKARSIDTIEGMQKHIKANVQLMSAIMNEYVEAQNKIHLNNENTIKNLNLKVEKATTFVDKLEKKLNVAEEDNLTDELTTVGNRKGYVNEINSARREWTLTKQPLTLMVLDVDNFKSINDNFGHSIGDQVLKCLGQTILKCVRSTDYVARYGGEEFAIILPATDLNKAVKLTKKIRDVINGLKFELRKKNEVLKITCSFGLSVFTEKLSNTTEVFNAADKALYQAKESGRDAIFISKDNQLIEVETDKSLA